MEYLLVCRSVTYAQQTKAVLDRSGISSKIVRTPVGVASESCGYSVKISDSDYHTALSVLNNEKHKPKRIIAHYSDGSYTEVNM